MQAVRVQRGGSGGFTLIEVLVALAIVALAMLALGRVGGQQLQQQAALEERLFAGWVADNQLTRARLGTVPGGRQSGVVEMGEREWQYEVSVSASPDPAVLRLDVAVKPGIDAPTVVRRTGFRRAR